MLPDTISKVSKVKLIFMKTYIYIHYTHVITSTKIRLKTNVATDEGNSRNEM